MASSPRSVRGIVADIEYTALCVRRAAGAAAFTATGVGWQAAAIIWTVAGAPEQAKQLLLASLGGLALAILMFLHWRPAAAVLASWGVAATIWLAVHEVHPFYVCFAAALGIAGACGAWYLRRLSQLREELRSTWRPHEVQTGDLYTVRDGPRFAVVKVLEVIPGRVHIRQYSLRYAERPWQVKTSTLARQASGAGPGAYPHLPLDRAEFDRWEPVLLRREPVEPDELGALVAWRRTQHSESFTGGA